MLGFRFPVNFNNPYTSGSITEFWRRWHMTLGAWMKNYLYIPLGGNRVESKVKLFFNLWIVFLISGFWHGAAWTFIFWGAYHGFWLILDRLGFEKILSRLGKWISAIITFFIVAVGWVFFRSDDIRYALRFIKRLFLGSNNGESLDLSPDFWFSLGLAILFSFFTLIPLFKKVQEAVYNRSYDLKGTVISAGISVILFMICISYITASNFNPFIYFRF